MSTIMNHTKFKGVNDVIKKIPDIMDWLVYGEMAADADSCYEPVRHIYIHTYKHIHTFIKDEQVSCLGSNVFLLLHDQRERPLSIYTYTNTVFIDTRSKRKTIKCIHIHIPTLYMYERGTTQSFTY